MKLFQKLRYFIGGALTMALIGGAVTTAYAALTGKTIEVSTGVNVFVDDMPLKMDTEAFIYNGRTYLPVRSVSDAIGKPISWDSDTRSVYIGKHNGTEPIAWLWDLNTFTGINVTKQQSVIKDNLGNEHDNCIQGNFTNTYKINKQYSKISGTLFQTFGGRSEYGTSKLSIYGDGKLLYEATVQSGVEPIDFAVNLTGVNELKIQYNKSGQDYISAIADCGLWQ